MGAPGPAIGEPVPGIRCVSVRSSAHLTLTARRTRFSAPKVQKVILDLPDRAKTSYTYEKVRLGRFGSAKVQKVQLFALLRFGPPGSGINAVHVCKSAKVTFCNFSIFYFFYDFHHFLTDGSNPYVFRCQINGFPVQTLQNPLFALFRYLAPPSDPCAFRSTFSEVNSMILGAQSALFAKKCGTSTFSTLGASESFKNDSVLKRSCGPFKMAELLAEKCTFGALLAPWVPGLAG